MSYAVDGMQYFAIAAGSDLFTFALPRSVQDKHANSKGVQKKY
jgi:alcohol dehydrogenase (cytochrome c)